MDKEAIGLLKVQRVSFVCPTTTVSITTMPTIESPEAHPHLSVEQINSAVNVQAGECTAEPPPRKRRKTQRKVEKKKVGPVYLCEVCQEEC